MSNAKRKPERRSRNSWTVYWNKDTAKRNEGPADLKYRDVIGDNSFRAKGVTKGDYIYAVSIWGVKLHMLGRWEVDYIVCTVKRSGGSKLPSGNRTRPRIKLSRFLTAQSSCGKSR